MHLAPDDIRERHGLPRKLEAPVRLAPLRLEAVRAVRGSASRSPVIDRRLVLRELPLAPCDQARPPSRSRDKAAPWPQAVRRRIMRRRTVRLTRGEQVMLQPQPCKIRLDPARKSLRRPLGVRVVKPGAGTCHRSLRANSQFVSAARILPT
jgi:hypothetical protein